MGLLVKMRMRRLPCRVERSRCIRSAKRWSLAVSPGGQQHGQRLDVTLEVDIVEKATFDEVAGHEGVEQATKGFGIRRS